MDIYPKAHKLNVSIDCSIFGFNGKEIELLLVKRKLVPQKGNWSLVGGFVRKDEDIDSAAYRILHELTGLNEIFMEQLGAFGKVDRDPNARVISIVYYALILKNESGFGHDSMKFQSQWFSIRELPKLIYDHDQMIERSLQRVQTAIRTTPIAFRLLPKMFTLPQLQRLYEGILDEKVDTRNFRRKAALNPALVNSGKKDKNESRKGAFLYTFDQSNDIFQL